MTNFFDFVISMHVESGPKSSITQVEFHALRSTLLGAQNYPSAQLFVSVAPAPVPLTNCGLKMFGIKLSLCLACSDT